MYSRRTAKNKAIKRALLRQVKSSRINIDDVLEWLWEDFGKKPARNWKNIEKTILGDNEITPQDLAVFMIDQGILPDEGAWDVEPAKGLPGRKGRVESG